MQTTDIIGISTLGIAVLVAALCVPLMLDRVPMNPIYGFRFGRSFESDEHWYAINRHGARWMFGWSLLLAAFGAVVLLAPASVAAAVLPAAPWAPLVLLIPALQAYRFARSLPPRRGGGA